MIPIDILNIKFNNINEHEFIDKISEVIYEREKITISFPNAYICLYSFQNKSLNKIINSFNYIVPDGIGVFKASRFLYREKGFREIVVSTDIWFKLFNNNYKYKYFFVGGDKSCKNLIETNFHKTNGFKIKDAIYKLSKPDEDLLKINNANADILMVALGTPFQEKWIYENKDKINIPVIIAVGSGLDFLAGVKKRAPLWMQNIGLEWLYRLFQEPKRLWKRYIIGIPVFMFHVFVQKAKLMLKKD